MESTRNLLVAAPAVDDSDALYRLLAEYASDVVTLGSNEGIWLWVSPSMAQLTGWRPDELVGQPSRTLFHPDSLGRFGPVNEALLRGEPGVFEAQVRTKDGSYRWISAHLRPILDDDGNVLGRVGGWRDVQKEHDASEALTASEQRYRLLAENASDVVFLAQADGAISWVSPSIAAVLGWRSDQVVGHRPMDFIHPGDVPAIVQAQGRLTHGETLEFEARVRTSSDGYRWVASRVSPVFDDSGVLSSRVGAWRDIEDAHAAREALRESETRYRLLAENSSDVVLLAQDGVMIWLSPSLSTTLGWETGEWAGHRFEEFIYPDDVPLVQLRRAEITAGAVKITTVRIRDRDGNYHWVEIHAGPHLDDDGQPDGILATFRIVDTEVAATKELEHLARFDSLTGLLNRKEILHKLSGISSSGRSPGQHTAVLFCDIDHFKDINDIHGHAAGDEVLRTLAERIGAAVRDEDYVARIGGDELLVILTAVHSLEDATLVAEKIRESASVSIGLDRARVSTTLSIGVTLVHPGEGVDVLVARADKAMYDAKERGRNQVVAMDVLA